MGIRDHVNRVAKLRARVVTVDPAQRLVEVVTQDGAVRRLATFDVPNGFQWPVEGEDWSIYEENGYWRLGSRFQNVDDALKIEDLQPGEGTIPGTKTFDASGRRVVTTAAPADGEIPVYDQLTDTYVPKPPASTGSDKHFAFSQNAPAAVWNVNHNLNKKPAVSVVDSAGTQVEGQVDYIDNDNVRLTFAGAFSGKAYFN